MELVGYIGARSNVIDQRAEIPRRSRPWGPSRGVIERFAPEMAISSNQIAIESNELPEAIPRTHPGSPDHARHGMIPCPSGPKHRRPHPCPINAAKRREWLFRAFATREMDAKMCACAQYHSFRMDERRAVPTRVQALGAGIGVSAAGLDFRPGVMNRRSEREPHDLA